MNHDDIMSRDEIMKDWDKWRKYIAEGGKASWPRDAFEALLVYFDEKIIKEAYEADAESRCPKCGELEPVLCCENCGHKWSRTA